MVSGSVSLPCAGYFSPFPHGTGSLSVSQEYLALPDGAGRFTQDFSGPVLLRILTRNYPPCFHVKGFHLLWPTFPGSSTNTGNTLLSVLQPQKCRNIFGLGYSAFARHYLRNHYCFLLLWVLRCFSSPRSPPGIAARISRTPSGWVAPFGYPRIKSYLHLPGAFRSLSRPSSPLRAKASTIRSCLFPLLSTSYSNV